MNCLPAEPEIAVIYPPHVMPRVEARSERVDAFLYIFGLCKQLQATCLDRRRIGCLIDGADLGRLPEAVCRMVGLMVCELVKDASLLTRAPRPLRVTLRRRGDICLCTVSSQSTADLHAESKPGLRRVRRLAADLDGACMVRSMPERGTVAIIFDARLIESSLPAAISRYRADTAVSE